MGSDPISENISNSALEGEKKLAEVDAYESVSSGSQEAIAYDEKATKRLLRKIDFTLIPFLALLYL
jgi:hypothetical protein